MALTKLVPHARYQEGFAQLERGLEGGTTAPVHQVRRRAMSTFAELGFPGPKHEEWRFTSVAPIATGAFAPVLAATASSVDPSILDQYLDSNADAYRVVTLSGFWVDVPGAGVLPPGLRIERLTSALEREDTEVLGALATLVPAEENGFTALNTAFLQDGVVLRVARDVQVDRPVEILHLLGAHDVPMAIYPRTLILVEAGAHVTVVESYAALKESASLVVPVTEMVLGEGAVVEHDRVLHATSQPYHVATMGVRQAGGSSLTSTSVVLGGRLVRNTIGAVLAGPGATCTLNGLVVSDGTQLVDNHTVIDHAAPSCESHEIYKSILGGAARGVFNGKIFVRKDAQKTDARQTNRTLLLSDAATMNTKPQLEIFADDVKCTHGATVGQIDDEQLFYLRARGIGEAEARDLLTVAFAGEVLRRIHVVPLRDQLDRVFRERLQHGRASQPS